MKSENRKIQTTMSNRINWMDGLLKIRKFNMGNKRSDFLFIYYNTLLSYNSPSEAAEALMTVNQKLGSPLSPDKLNKLINQLNSSENPYRFTNEAIIAKLKITNEEIDRLQIGHNKKLKAERAKRKSEKGEIERSLSPKIIKMFQDGKSQKEIIALVPELSSYTIKKILAPYVVKRKEERDHLIANLYTHGFSVSEISQKLGLSRDTIYSALSVEEKTKLTISEKRENVSLLPLSDGCEQSALFTLHKTEMRQAALSQETIANGRNLIQSKNYYITGSSGTGKSYFLNQYLNSLPYQELKNTVIASPTGLAASHVNGTTLHAAFHLSNEIQPNTEIEAVPERLLSMTRLVIDEISMVRLDVFTKVIKMIQYIEKQQHRKIQIIVSGDFGQLPPVVSESDKSALKAQYPEGKTFYAFESPLWEELQFSTIVLAFGKRFEDTDLYEHLIEIKYGLVSALDWFNNNSAWLPDPNAPYICTTNNDVRKYTQLALQQYKDTPQVVFAADKNGDIDNEELPCPETLSLAIGMKVMTVVNDKLYKNGTVGIISRIDRNSIDIITNDYTKITIKKKVFHLANGSIYRQLPIIYAFAMTVNKAQGCTFDAINIVGRFFAPGQLYVALSRCRSIKNIYIDSPLTPKDLIINIDALKHTV